MDSETNDRFKEIGEIVVDTSSVLDMIKKSLAEIDKRVTALESPDLGDNQWP